MVQSYIPKTIHGKHREYISHFFTPSYSNPSVMKNLENYFKDSQIWSDLRRDAKTALDNDEFNGWYSKEDAKDTAYEVLEEWNERVAGDKFPEYNPSAKDMNQFAKLIYNTFNHPWVTALEKIKIQEAKENGTYKSPAKKTAAKTVNKASAKRVVTKTTTNPTKKPTAKRVVKKTTKAVPVKSSGAKNPHKDVYTPSGYMYKAQNRKWHYQNKEAYDYPRLMKNLENMFIDSKLWRWEDDAVQDLRKPSMSGALVTVKDIISTWNDELTKGKGRWEKVTVTKHDKELFAKKIYNTFMYLYKKYQKENNN